jgi:hypothetical protein
MPAVAILAGLRPQNQRRESGTGTKKSAEWKRSGADTLPCEKGIRKAENSSANHADEDGKNARTPAKESANHREKLDIAKSESIGLAAALI